MFVSFEGGEGAGKSTLLQKLYDTLQKTGFSVLLTRAPGGTRIGTQIRELLLSEKTQGLSVYAELFLFLADRAQHVEEVILPSLKKGMIVLCDRFNDSTIAYQGSRGLDIQKIWELCLFASQNLSPDLTLYLDLDPIQGLRRIQKEREKDRIENEELKFHQKIRDIYHTIALKEPDRFRILDASKSSEQIYQDALTFFPSYR